MDKIIWLMELKEDEVKNYIDIHKKEMCGLKLLK